MNFFFFNKKNNNLSDVEAGLIDSVDDQININEHNYLFLKYGTLVMQIFLFADEGHGTDLHLNGNTIEFKKNKINW